MCQQWEQQQQQRWQSAAIVSCLAYADVSHAGWWRRLCPHRFRAAMVIWSMTGSFNRQHRSCPLRNWVHAPFCRAGCCIRPSRSVCRSLRRVELHRPLTPSFATAWRAQCRLNTPGSVGRTATSLSAGKRESKRSDKVTERYVHISEPYGTPLIGDRGLCVRFRNSDLAGFWVRVKQGAAASVKGSPEL